MIVLIASTRGRTICDDKLWTQILEIGCDISNTITSVEKTTMFLFLMNWMFRDKHPFVV